MHARLNVFLSSIKVYSIINLSRTTFLPSEDFSQLFMSKNLSIIFSRNVPFLGSGNFTLNKSWKRSMDIFITCREYLACSILSGVANTRIWKRKHLDTHVFVSPMASFRFSLKKLTCTSMSTSSHTWGETFTSLTVVTSVWSFWDNNINV